MKQFVTTIKRNFLYINSEDSEVLRKGHLIQFLVLLLSFVTIGFLFFSVVQIFFVNPTLPTFTFVNPGLFFLFPLLIVSWWLARNGRIRRSSHLFAVGTNVIFFIGFLYNNDPAIPYLMLVSVVAIAALDSVQVSTIYALVTILAVGVAFAINPEFYFLDFIRYLLTMVGICITVWVTARDLNFSVLGAKRLNRDIFNKNSQLQRNASLLQLSAEVAQLTSQSLNLDVLLKNSVTLIRDRFGFFYVAVYLINHQKDALFLKEATGTLGNQLVQNRHTLSLDEESLITAVAISQKTQIGKPNSQAPHLKEIAQNTKAEIALPLISRGNMIGVLDLHSRTENSFQEQDIAVFDIMANQIAVNIDNATLYSESETRFNETKALFDLTNHLTQTFDIGEIYRMPQQLLTPN